MIQRLVIILFFAGLHYTAFGQSSQWTKVSNDELSKAFKDIQNFYNTTVSFKVDITHKSFKTHTTTEAFESKNGFFEKNGKLFHSYMLGIRTIQDNKLQVSIDSSQHAILVNNITQTSDMDWTQMSQEDLMSSIQSVQYKSGTTSKTFQVEYQSPYPISKFSVEINHQGWIQKIVLYYRKELKDPETEKFSSPRLEISYKNFKNQKIDPSIFDLSNIIKQSGKDIKPVGFFKDYNLIDLRANL